MRKVSSSFSTRTSDDYFALVKRFHLRGLRNEREHDEAVGILGRLLGRSDGKLSEGERDYAQVLGRLIDDYADKLPVMARRKHSPVELLRFLMQENGMSVTDLGKVLGSKAAASFILNVKRELSKAHIRKLAARFGVDAGIFF